MAKNYRAELVGAFGNPIDENPTGVMEEAAFAAESRFFLENKSVIHYQSVMSKSVRNEYVLTKKMQELFQLLNRREAEDILKCLDEFTTLLEQDNRYDVDYVRTLFLQIAFSISNTLDCRSGDCDCHEHIHVPGSLEQTFGGEEKCHKEEGGCRDIEIALSGGEDAKGHIAAQKQPH